MRYIALIFSLLTSLNFFAQETLQQDQNYQEINPNKGSDGFSLVDRWPMYPGGEQGINQYIKRELTYPEEALKDSIEGRVIVRYVVETDGSVGEIEVIQRVHPVGALI